MSGFIERHQVIRPMTGSTIMGHLRPQEDDKPSKSPDPGVGLVSPCHRRLRQRMTPVPPERRSEMIDQPIQLTPLWEHVVRTQQFPPDIDKQSTFNEISERLRDPEWEVRQHALRVLIDVLPTLPRKQVDRIVCPVVSELINNLGHLAPSVRKGALDALRVYLLSTEQREKVLQNILQSRLSRSHPLDAIQISITQGLILSTPSLLFPSATATPPSDKILKTSIATLANHLIQITHQEAALKSLIKIRDSIGLERFNAYLGQLNPNTVKDFQVLCEVYRIQESPPRKKKKARKNEEHDNKIEIETKINRVNETPEDNSIPSSRVVLETEIKLNEETAITMTILEQKDNLEYNSDLLLGKEEQDKVEENSKESWIEKRKTPRRVHFGGEIVKLRTPDSDDSETLEIDLRQTKIPLPIAPTTKMPLHLTKKSLSNPSSPNLSRSRDKSIRQRSRSASAGPRRGFYVHDGSLSPKKGILTKTNSSMSRIKSKSLEDEKYFNGDLDQVFGMKENDRSWSFEIFEDLNDEVDPRKILNVRQSPMKKQKKMCKTSANKRENNAKVKIEGSEITNELHFMEETSESRVEDGNIKVAEVSEHLVKSDKDNSNLIIRTNSFSLSTNKNGIENEMKKKSPTRSPRKTVYESFPRQERNYILMELSSPVKMSSKSREVSPEAASDAQVKENTLAKDNGEVVLTKETTDKTFEEREKNGQTDGRILEPNWEDLGLVTQDVLDDLHNKDDWRARVRGLERVASALRTSSALVAIEPRLGSLLQAVLGGERSCRVAAAAMSVARVVIAGVSEEALKRRLSQVAWGLSRQGGPNAAQLARIAMLRLRPALFLEQLLQPHCIEARNAKTRENALQLLIFSLVTFPSTEFKVENVANKVALMVADRRRRVRQAALDTLAVLAQIYEPEEVLQAGNRAAKQLNEGTDMVAAIRARLARKSLPMVSADGLVVYGLQISPTVQIATGPDVDWIVAGSGSVSPGTGRARGQIIPPNIKGGLDKNKNEPAKPCPLSKPNFIALGVSINSKNDRSIAWQFIPSDKDENNLSQEIEDEDRNESALSIETSSIRSRYDDTYSPFILPSDNPGEPYPSPLHSYHLKNDKDVIMKQRKTEENFHRRMDEIYAERRDNVIRLESRIPVAQFRDRQIVVRHSTAYQRRRREDEDDHPPSSAPNTSAGLRFSDLHESDISRRYRSDRIKYSSRPASEDRARDTRLGNSPIREGYESVYQEPRRRSGVELLTVETRRNSSSHSGSIQPVFSQVQESDLSTRVSCTPSASGEKTNLAEDENNEKNLHYVSAQETPYRNDSQADQVHQPSGNSGRKGADHVPVSSALSSIENHRVSPQQEEEEEAPSEPISRRNSFGEKSFDIITNDSNPSRRNSIERVAVNVLSSGAELTEPEKELSSSEESGRDNDSDDKSISVRLAVSASSVVSDETNSTDSTIRISGSPVRNDIKAVAFDHQDVSTDTPDGPDISLEFDRSYSTELKIDIESRVRASIHPETKTHFQQTDFRDPDDNRSSCSLENVTTSNTPTAVNSVSIVVASRPNSRSTTAEYREEPAFQPLDYRQPHTDENTTSPSIFQLSRTFEEQQQPHSTDVTSDQVTVASSDSFTELPNVPEIHVVTISSKLQRNTTPMSSENVLVQDVVKIHEIETAKRLPSRVPRSRIKSRPGLNKVTPIGHHVDKTPARAKPVTVQCISQLESNDWEMTIRGLKSLSTIARQTPEQLDGYSSGTVGRLLGRHIKNLRSQVARTACLAAGDVFTSQARCIDQDLDDIAGPLLQRTADTNKFLRADSNAALDRMIEHIPPHKTITVIVHRGASHQNAIVRAATARLLVSLVDRVGPDLTMSLPRDVRDKLLGAGAKLLMDGNLDARNYAKMMFKRLSRCDGFRRALTDAVPETTLRHIDKTLRSL